jgi:hypothetical protein
MKALNLATMGHSRQSIRDQIFFLEVTCSSLGIYLTVQNNIDRRIKNLLIEGNIPNQFKGDIDFIRRNPSQFSMVLTEHLELSHQGQYFLNGISVHENYLDTIDPNIFPSDRFRALVANADLPLFLILGNLPSTYAYEKLFPNSRFAQLPWPSFSIKHRAPKRKGLVFSVPDPKLISPFRAEVLKEISRHGHKVSLVQSNSFLDSVRTLSNFSAVLDISKTFSWKYDSPMRSYLSILAGRNRVNIRGGEKPSPISEICDLPFQQFISLSSSDLESLRGQIPSKFEDFINSQDRQGLELFRRWFFEIDK